MKNTKKSFKLSLISTLLIIAIIFSLLSYDTTTSKAEGNEFMRYYNGNEVMYVNIKNCIDNWWKNECTHRIYFFGKDTAWGNLEQIDETGVYKVTVPEGQYNKLIICRCKDENSTWENNGVYNKTGDISILPEQDYICIFNGENSPVAGWTTYENYAGPIITTGTNISRNNDYVTKGNDTNTADGGVVLHAFCWSYNEIRENMADIANAGYTAVQTSPVQPPKDYNPKWKTQEDEWWKLYQPLGYTISDKSTLGTKRELEQMCQEADKYGIKVIVDIVANHLAADFPSKTDLYSQVKEYEPTIYNNPNEYIHNYVNISDNSIEGVVYGNMELPDINTAHPYIQERVISLLKECIDCGVTGFRFDAAKHIETPDDYQWASDFWPNITSEARAYAQRKGVDIFMYGEILAYMTCGRQYSSYTKYMDVIDNRSSDKVLSAVCYNNSAEASNCHYESGEKASNLVLWAESHDTYMRKTGSAGIENTEKVDEFEINKAWSIVGSRADATALYLARPNVTMGIQGSTAWKNKEVIAVNYFHNRFNGAKEYLSNNNNIVINERYFDNGEQGAVLTNINGSSNVNLRVNILNDGTYIDVITKNVFTVSNGYINGTIGDTDIAVLYKYN